MTTAFAGAVLDADGRPFDRIRLTGLSATGHHGVFEHEKAQGQLFRADVVLHLDTRAAASGDDLSRTVSYAGVAEDVVAVLAGSPADLVETVAERIAATILTHDDVVAVDVAVHKPQAPITVPFEDVEVVIRRDRVVVPVVAPLSRRAEQSRDAQPVGPIPVGSVAPALIHGVGDVPAPDDRATLAPAPDVMPPSILPGAAGAPGEDPRTAAETGAEAESPEDALDATREAPAVRDDVAPGDARPDAQVSAEAPYGEAPYGEPAHDDAAAHPQQAASYDELVAGSVPGNAPEHVLHHGAPPVAPGAPSGEQETVPGDAAPAPVEHAAPEAEPLPYGAAAEPAPAHDGAHGGAQDATEAAAPVEHDRMDDVPAGFVEVVLALGANLGDAQQTLRDAITDLDRISGLEITEVSPLARTEAVGGPDQPDYLNTVLLARTRLSARDLLHACQSVEQAHGRVRDERWGPRTLDVDLIVYGTLTAVADDLELPHPRAHERAFVLEPWSQIDPDAVLPGLGGGPVAALAATAPDRGGIRWLALDWLTDPAPDPAGAVPVTTGSTDTAAPPPAPVDVPVDVPVGDPYQQAHTGPVAAPYDGPATPGGGVPAPDGSSVPQHPAPQQPHVPQPVPPHEAHPAQQPAAPQQQPAPQPQQPPQQQPQQPPHVQHAERPQPPAPETALPVAPPQAPVVPQPAGLPQTVTPSEALPARPVFAPVSEGVAPEGAAPPIVPDGSFDPREDAGVPVAPFPGPSNRPPSHPEPAVPDAGDAPDTAPRPAQDAVRAPEHGAPAHPVFAPVHAPEPVPAAPQHPAASQHPAAQPPVDAASSGDGMIRSVPFAPVSGSGQESAPGPLADPALHPANDPWPPFGPVSGSGRDDER
ncbi:2-amino-4-hydroxy-6-hydroxymethyldihydropteridine diphosphokinase [Cellulosimicrobium cellulans]|uniref:2-amino-4-hydroxy-6- hydroxymethyldihydropteridine diphosphokinase n=1 Tax=Cellulosimicrobium cellulans TaxID=1710 RepID=UPI00214A5DE4|nr:2-amino-4-hydroxy-6-hydroxymethyldihydropteridine diphosphokinase [Cellulosimicrobium cellulans]